MQCFKCGEAILVIDAEFCEACGTPITEKQPSPYTAAGYRCEKCGALSGEIDGDGYCLQCGFRQLSPDRDRLEVLINSDLAGVSDRGLRHRRNEDFLALHQVDVSSPAQIVVVCDGVSSSDQPEIASRTAAQSACEYLTTTKIEDNSPALIHSAIVHALKSVCEIPIRPDANTDAPSTTIVAAIIQNGTATIGWLGDSRAYWIADQNSQQLTQDHSWLSEVVAAGEMSQAEAEKSPHAHAITRWLGADAQADVFPSIIDFTIPSSGYILLCTDGLWNYAPEADILASLIKTSLHLDAITVSRSLVDFARNCGGHDNITVGIYRVST
jgi:serine/threonine protein phosphatase PrpC/ribosomal protein L37E